MSGWGRLMARCLLWVLVGSGRLLAAEPAPPAGPATTGSPDPAGTIPVYIALHWHMHQPIYWPGEDIMATSRNPGNSVDVLGILSWPDRIGAYTHYPVSAMRPFLDLAHAGVQVSFSGSLIENLEVMAAAGHTYGSGWAARYREARGWRTGLGHPRFDLVAFGYHHPLMAFLDYDEIRRQIRDHREAILRTFGGPASKGLFPPENAFTLPMIPALVDEGLEWVLVDNAHMDRACRDYPYSQNEKIPPPNPADQLNPPQERYVTLNCQTNTVQSVGAVGLRPHRVEYVDPATGTATTPDGRPARMVVVPTERSLGYDDSYGDRSPIPRLAALEPLNTDPGHPLLVVLAHDGDNFGASGSRYYLETLQWIRSQPDRYVLTTVEDYLHGFPPDEDDVIHVEDGSWIGADLGDATFTKWLGPPYKDRAIDWRDGWSSDWNSWAAILGARNWVRTARAAAPDHPALARAERFAMVAVTSCYWYWDGTHEWDSKPTLAANEAVAAAREVLGPDPADGIGPSLFPPQRFPVNPGLAVPGGASPPAFTVYTLAHDLSGLASIDLKLRSLGAALPGPGDFTHAGTWETVPMQLAPMSGTPPTTAAAAADRYAARVTDVSDRTVVYFVEATDRRGHTSRTVVKAVGVGDGLPGGDLPWTPPYPRETDPIVVSAPRAARLHWGINGWTKPAEALWPPGTTPWPDGKAVETPMVAGVDGRPRVTLGPILGHDVERIDFVYHFADGTWGQDQTILVTDVGKAWRDRDRLHGVGPDRPR